MLSNRERQIHTAQKPEHLRLELAFDRRTTRAYGQHLTKFASPKPSPHVGPAQHRVQLLDRDKAASQRLVQDLFEKGRGDYGGEVNDRAGRARHTDAAYVDDIELPRRIHLDA